MSQLKQCSIFKYLCNLTSKIFRFDSEYMSSESLKVKLRNLFGLVMLWRWMSYIRSVYALRPGTCLTLHFAECPLKKALWNEWCVRRSPWTQNLNWTYIKRSKDVQDVLGTFNLRPASSGIEIQLLVIQLSNSNDSNGKEDELT